MAIPLKISLEQLAEALNSLSVSEREELKSLLENQWYEIVEIDQTIQEILSKSTAQHQQGKFRASDDIIREAKEKYGL